MSASNHFDKPEPAGSDPAELAALYLSGAMSDPEREVFEQRLARGDEACARELDRLQDAAEALLQNVEPVAPPTAVRERLMRLIAPQPTPPREHKGEQIWRDWDSEDASEPLFTLRADQGDWEETGVAGVQVRRLFVDRPANRMTAMFRMAAGADYPEHVHDGPEECYVLDGDLHVGDELIMRRGDYQRAMPGSEHGRQWTQDGCLLLVTCALTDEMV